MMRDFFLSLMGSMLLSAITSGQTNEPFPVLYDADLPDLRIAGTTVYSNESLYGYIDGGAELYLEYGFDSLIITEVVFAPGNIRAEVYRMKDPAAAFGIFSVSRFRCMPGSVITQYQCRSKYQFQFYRGCYYVSIVNNNGTVDEQQLSEKIAGLLVGRIEGDDFNPVEFFNDQPDSILMSTAVVARGRLGLINRADGLAPSLEESTGYTAMIINPGERTLISVIFDTDESMDRFLVMTGADSAVMTEGKKLTTAAGEQWSITGVRRIVVEIK